MADIRLQNSVSQYGRNMYPDKAPNSVLFLDDLPPAPKNEDSKVTTNEIKKWRFQQILASHPWGIPSLAFISDYKKFFERDLNLDMKDMGYHDFHEMITSLNDIFTIQKPDDITCLIFPKYAEDFILHDARLKHNFDTMSDNTELKLDNQNKLDYDWLVGLANLNRDEPFPNDVALAGKEYEEFLLPQNLANIENTRGVYKVLLTSGTNPGHFFVNFHNDYDRVQAMINDLANYYVNLPAVVDTHMVPDEFIYNGFPCVLYDPKTKLWERCSIMTKTKNKVIVDMVDLGGFKEALRTNLFLMPQKFLEIPKQAVCLSLAGILPLKDEKYTANARKRLLNFSASGYKLDCLLLDHTRIKETEQHNRPANGSDCPENGDKKQETKRRLRKITKKVQFEAILCDRNDEYFDLFLDEILVMEIHCKSDDSRKSQIETLRSEFKKALQNIPRDVCPI